MLRFRKGLFEVARGLGVQVVPAALRYRPRELAWTGDTTFLPHYLRFAALRHSTVELAFGDPLRSQAYPTAERLAYAARTCTLSMLENRTASLRRAR